MTIYLIFKNVFPSARKHKNQIGVFISIKNWSRSYPKMYLVSKLGRFIFDSYYYAYENWEIWNPFLMHKREKQKTTSLNQSNERFEVTNYRFFFILLQIIAFIAFRRFLLYVSIKNTLAPLHLDFIMINGCLWTNYVWDIVRWWWHFIVVSFLFTRHFYM